MGYHDARLPNSKQCIDHARVLLIYVGKSEDDGGEDSFQLL